MTPKSQTILIPSCDCDECVPHHHHNNENEGRVNEELLDLKSVSSDIDEELLIGDQIMFVNDIINLEKIHEKSVQLAVWQRSNLPGFMKTLCDPTLAAQSLPTFEQIVTTDTASQTLRYHFISETSNEDNFDSERLPLALDDAELIEMIEEMVSLVKVFSEISGSEKVNLKLERVDDNRCQYWHQDCVPLRLVATYRGPCTEWIPPMFAEQALQNRKDDCSHALSFCHRDVALFKGCGEGSEIDALDHNCEKGIVHRSPRIEGQGIHRILLVLDIPQKGWHF